MADEFDDKEWLPTSTLMKPDLATLLVEDPARDFDPGDTITFFERLAEDYGPMEIGLSMGWSPAMVNRFMADKSRGEIIAMITDAQHESVERAIVLHARAGNSTALKLYAYNKMQHRGWADRSKLEITGRSQHEIVLSVREALDAKLTEAVSVGGAEGIKALQAGYLTADIPVDDDDVIDAEVVDEDLHG